MLLRNPLNRFVAVSLIAASATTLHADAQVRIVNSRLAIDESQNIVTTNLPPGVDFARPIRDIERLYISNSGEIFANVQLDKNEQINPSRVDAWLYSAPDVTDGIVDPFLMSRDTENDVIPDSYALLNGDDFIRHSNNGEFAHATDDGFITIGVLNSPDSTTGFTASGERLERLTGFETGAYQGEVIFDVINNGVGQQTSLTAPNIDAGSTDSTPLATHATRALFSSSNTALIQGEDATGDKNAYYLVDTTGQSSTVQRIVGNGDTLNLVGGGTATLNNVFTPRHRAEAAKFAGIEDVQTDGESTFYSQTTSGDWFAVGTTGQTLAGFSGAAIESFLTNDGYAVHENGRVTAVIVSKDSDDNFLDGVLVTDPTIGTSQIVATPGTALTDGSGRAIANYFRGIDNGSARFGVGGTVLFNGDYEDSAGTIQDDALFMYNPANGDLTMPLFEGMTVPGTDLVLSSTGLNLTSYSDELGISLAVVRATNDEDSLGYMLLSFDALGNIDPVLLPEDELTFDGQTYLVGDDLRVLSGFGEYHGLTDKGYFAVRLQDGSIGALQMAIPEPSSAMLLGAAGMLLISRRRRRTA